MRERHRPAVDADVEVRRRPDPDPEVATAEAKRAPTPQDVLVERLTLTGAHADEEPYGAPTGGQHQVRADRIRGRGRVPFGRAVLPDRRGRLPHRARLRLRERELGT